MQKSDQAIKTDQISEALSGVVVIPKGRSLRRYTHGWNNIERTEYFIGYNWMRPYSNHMTGMVYDATIARGRDFDDALAKAKAAMLKKRQRNAAG